MRNKISIVVITLIFASVLCFAATPELVKSIQKGKAKPVIELIKNGADVNDNGGKDLSPVMQAILRFQKSGDTVKIVQAMIEHGADVNYKNLAGDTALTYTGRYGNKKTVQELINAGADINAQNNKGETALHLSLKHNNIKLVETFVENGAEVNTQDEKGITPLMSSLDYVTTIMNILLKAGADPNIKDNEGKNALQHTDSPMMSKILRKYGAEGENVTYVFTQAARDMFSGENVILAKMFDLFVTYAGETIDAGGLGPELANAVIIGTPGEEYVNTGLKSGGKWKIEWSQAYKDFWDFTMSEAGLPTGLRPMHIQTFSSEEEARETLDEVWSSSKHWTEELSSADKLGKVVAIR